MLGILKYIVGDIFIHPAVIKFFGELDLIIKYEEIVGRFHLYAFVKTKLQRKSEIRKIGVKVLADRRFREADKKPEVTESVTEDIEYQNGTVTSGKLPEGCLLRHVSHRQTVFTEIFDIHLFVRDQGCMSLTLIRLWIMA